MEKIKILVVDDDTIILKYLVKFTKNQGYEVFSADNGKDAYEIFKKNMPHIILSDLRMPEMDGMELLHSVRKICKSSEFIFLTEFRDSEKAIQALRYGVTDYLKKPINLDRLQSVLDSVKEKLLRQKKELPPPPVVLLVEDNKETNYRLTRFLKTKMLKVHAAFNGEEALEFFKKNKVDVVLLDISMPKMNGIDTLKEMKSLRDDFEAIIMTGYYSESDAIEALRIGAYNLIEKPICIEQLYFYIEKAIEKLLIKKVLNYRNRELELSKQLSAKVTEENKLLINSEKHFIQNSDIDFLAELFKAIPVS